MGGNVGRGDWKAVHVMASIEDAIDARVRVAVKEEVRNAFKEAMAHMGPGNDDEWLTVAQGSKRAGVHPETFRLWIRDGRLPRHKGAGGWRVKRSELDTFLSRNDTPKAKSAEDIARAFLNRKRGA